MTGAEKRVQPRYEMALPVQVRVPAGPAPEVEALSKDISAGGLDAQKFDACLSGGKYKTQVEEDVQAGRRAGVTGTPTFFLNGILLTGAQPVSAFEKTIEAELALLKQSRDRR